MCLAKGLWRSMGGNRSREEQVILQCFVTLVQGGWARISYYEHRDGLEVYCSVWAVRLAMITLGRDTPRTWILLTARKVLTTLAMAASLSSPSSWIGAFLMSSLNWGVGLLSPWELARC